MTNPGSGPEPRATARTGYLGTAVLALAVAAVLWAAVGCGRKADPMAPRHVPLARIQDLAGSMAGNVLQLRWTLPPAALGGEGPAFVRIHQARTIAGDTPCPACPPVFKPAAELPVAGPIPATGRAMEMPLALEPGYRYRFKATVHAGDRRAGEDSNWVVVDH